MIALHCRSETTLRAEGQACQGDVTSCFLNTLSQLFGGFQIWFFSRNQAKYDNAILRDMLQYFKTARTLIVVLQQEALKVGPSEDLRDRLVVTAGIEFALVIATT